MKEKRYGTLGGLTVPCLVYESYVEADTAAGKELATLNEGNDSGYYRGPANDVRDKICDLVEELTGVERKTKETGKKDDKGNPVLVFDEAEGAYCKRAMAEQGQAEFDLTQFQAQLDEWTRTAAEGGNPLAVNFKLTERKPSAPKKLPGQYKATAEKVLANPDREAALAKVESIFGSTGTAMPALTGDSAKDIDLLGWAMKAHKDAQAKKELEQFVA